MTYRGAISYAAVQFSAEPDRFEALNVGVVVIDRSERRMLSKMTDDFSRVTKHFGNVNKTFLTLTMQEFVERLRAELADGSQENLERFRRTRANNLRLTPFMPVNAGSLEEAKEILFEELVGAPKKTKRSSRVGTRLKNGLRDLDVLKFFDQRPEPLTLPRFNYVLKPDLAIKKGHYQLIEAVRFDDPDEGFSAAGTHSLIGRALHANDMSYRLVVVGDFGEQPAGFYNAVREDLSAAHTKLFRLDDLGTFASEMLPQVLH